MTTVTDGPTDPPQGPQQPRWAWWVVGIVIPLVGVLFTVLVSGSGSSDDKSVEPAPTQTSASTVPTGKEQPTASPALSAAAAKVRYGPVVIETDMAGGGQSVELDSTEPILMGALAKGEDFGVGATSGAPDLWSTGSTESTLASIAASGRGCAART